MLVIASKTIGMPLHNQAAVAKHHPKRNRNKVEKLNRQGNPISQTGAADDPKMLHKAKQRIIKKKMHQHRQP